MDRSKVLDRKISDKHGRKMFRYLGYFENGHCKIFLTQEQLFSRVNHIIRCKSKLLPLGFAKFVLVLIL